MVKLTLSPNIMRGIELGNSAFSMFWLKLSRNIRFMQMNAIDNFIKTLKTDMNRK